MFNVERRTHWAIVNLLRATDDECSPVLFSLNRSDVEVTVLLQVYLEDRILLFISIRLTCALADAFWNDFLISDLIGVRLQQDLASTLPALFRLEHDATQVRLLVLRLT